MMSGSRSHSPDPRVSSFIRKSTSSPVETLFWIQNQIAAIYSTARANRQDDKPPALGQSTYLGIWTAIYEYNIASKSARGNLDGGDLYRWLVREIRDYCQDIRLQVFVADNNVEDDGARRLLKAYMSQYNKFTRLSKLVRNLMQLLERHWIRREIDEKKKNVFLIGDLHEMVWREDVLRVCAKTMSTKKEFLDVADAVTELREIEGEMTEYDTKLVKSVVKSLSSLGLSLDG